MKFIMTTSSNQSSTEDCVSSSSMSSKIASISQKKNDCTSQQSLPRRFSNPSSQLSSKQQQDSLMWRFKSYLMSLESSFDVYCEAFEDSCKASGRSLGNYIAGPLDDGVDIEMTPTSFPHATLKDSSSFPSPPL